MLAIARKDQPKGHRDLNFSDVERNATLIGLLGLLDPPREEVLAAIRECQEAGIAVKMITGDHAATAEAIARELRLAPEPVTMTGSQLDGVDDTELEMSCATSPCSRGRALRTSCAWWKRCRRTMP
ncbi:HAD family hydrolase [Methyloceanibacter marginalis]